MRNRLLLGVAWVPFFLGGCGSAGSEADPATACVTGASPLTGCWTTEQCGQVSDAQGNLLEIWAKSTYRFAADGTIGLGLTVYADASCNGNRLSNYAPATQPNVTYDDLGEELLSDGSAGRHLHVKFTADSAQTFSVDAYASINETRLCLSRNFYLGPLGPSTSEMQGTDIDYKRCLVATDGN